MAVWSVVKISQFVGAFRLDAEFWQPDYLTVERAVEKVLHLRLGELVTSLRKGVFNILAESYVEQGIPFYRSSNVGQIIPKEAGLAFITPAKHVLEWKTGLKRGDIMLAKTGKEAASVVLCEECNISQDVIGIRVDRKKVNPFYLAVFLNTSPGMLQMRRWFQGQVQLRLSLPDARQILVPILPESLQKRIEDSVHQAEREYANALEGMSEAERLLASALGLNKLDLSPNLFYERPCLDLIVARRFDAEYFQPKYDTLLSAIRRHGAVRLGDAVRQPVRRGISPTYFDDGDLTVINSQQVGKVAVELDDNRMTREALFDLKSEDNRTGVVRKGDVLLNSTGRITIGRCQCLLDDVVAVVDNHIAIIRPQADLDPVYLASFLNTMPGLMQTERGYTGSSGQIELRPDVIEDYLIWKAPQKLQLAIRQQIERAHAARREGRRLLQQAKVEIERLILGSAKKNQNHVRSS